MTEENFLVCGLVENMVFPLAERFNCCECKKEIGAGKTSLKAMEGKEFKPICQECFIISSKSKDEVIIQRPTEEQLKELRTEYPNFGEEEIRNVFNKMKMKGWKLK